MITNASNEATEELLRIFHSFFIPLVHFRCCCCCCCFSIHLNEFTSQWTRVHHAHRILYAWWWSHFLGHATHACIGEELNAPNTSASTICCAVDVSIVRWMIFCKILYRNYGWPPPPSLERVYAYAWCLGICVTHRWLCRCCCCCCCWPVLLVYFYYSIILIVQRMRYSCMHSNIIDCVEKWCAWKDKNFKANGIFNFRTRISIRCAQDVPNDNDRNKKRKFTTRLESHACVTTG